MYSTNYKVDYLFTQDDLTTSILRMMYYVQETSLLHSEDVGLSMEWFSDNNTGFILTGWNIKVYKLPKWGDKIIATTWPNNIKKMLADRSFVLKDVEGNTLLEAQSNWIYLDLDTLKPIVVADEVKEKYGEQYPSVLEHRFRIDKLAGYDLIKEDNYIVNKSDIDSNRHMNNISYIKLAFDVLDINQSNIDSMVIKYVMQSILDEVLSLKIYQNDNKYIISILCDNEVRCNLQITTKQ